MQFPNFLQQIDFSTMTGSEIGRIIEQVTGEYLYITLTYIIMTFISIGFDFNLIELSLQHLFDQFTDFVPIFFDVITFIEIQNETKEQKEKFHEFLMEVIKMKIIPDNKFKEKLNRDTLAAIRLINKPAVFMKKESRFITQQYRETKYNILRECPLGYSILINELFWGYFDKPSFEETYEKILNIIGAFDLDPARAVDITFNLFAAFIEKDYEYFINFLINSPWYSNHPPSGVKLFTDVIDFKLVNLLKVSDTSKSIKERYYHVVAHLIKHDLVDSEILYSHIYPNAEDFDTKYKEYLNAIRSEGHELVHDSLDSMIDITLDELIEKSNQNENSNDRAIQEEEDTSYNNQKIGIINALLCIGALDKAEELIMIDPRILGYDKDCSRLVCRLIKGMVEKAVDTNSLVYNRDSLFGLCGPSNNAIKIQNKIKVFNPLYVRMDEEFYYKGWMDEINQKGIATENFDQVFKWLHIIGPNINDYELFTTLAILLKTRLLTDNGIANDNPWYQVLLKNLLPGLQFLDGDCQKSHGALWDAIRGIPLELRYGIYSVWINSAKFSTQEFMNKRFSNTKKTNQLISRITNENATEFAGYFKVLITHDPASIFKPILFNVMRYDRIEPYIPTLDYSSDLSADVFMFTLLDLLADPEGKRVLNPSRLKDDCINIESWLKSLASFVARLLKQTDVIRSEDFLIYVINQLHAQNNFDLIFFSEILSQMGGVESFINISDLYSLNGGKVLKAECFPQITTFRASANSSSRLFKNLVNNNILSALIILICSQLQNVVYNNKTSPYLQESNVPGLIDSFVSKYYGGLYNKKVMASHYDTIHDIVLRFTEFLYLHLNSRNGGNLNLPSLEQLVIEYKISPVLAFNFIRPYISQQVEREYKQILEGNRNLNEREQGEVNEEKVKTYTINDIETLITTSEIATKKSSGDIWMTKMKPIIVECQNFVSKETFNFISPGFYATFWQLRLFDLMVPEKQYDNQINKLKEMLNVHKNKRPNKYDESKWREDSRWREENNDLLKRLDNLIKEKEDHILLQNQVFKRILIEKDDWFVTDADPKLIAECFIASCLLPRLVFSRSDAMYCAKLIFLLHSLNLKNYSLTFIINGIFKYIQNFLFICTPSEASHVGVFIKELIYNLMRWYKDKKVYESEAIGKELIGFKLDSGLLSSTINKEDIKSTHLTHEEFRGLIYNLHDNLYNIFYSALKSSEYLQIVNSISILHKIEKEFPLARYHFEGLISRIESVITIDIQKEFTSLAIGYKGILNKNQTNSISKNIFLGIPEPRRPTTSTRTGRDRYDDPYSKSSSRPSNLPNRILGSKDKLREDRSSSRYENEVREERSNLRYEHENRESRSNNRYEHPRNSSRRSPIRDSNYNSSSRTPRSRDDPSQTNNVPIQRNKSPLDNRMTSNQLNNEANPGDRPINTSNDSNRIAGSSSRPINTNSESNRNSVPRRPDLPSNSNSDLSRLPIPTRRSEMASNSNIEPNRNPIPSKRTDIPTGSNNDLNRSSIPARRSDTAFNSNNESNRNLEPSRRPDIPSNSNNEPNRIAESSNRPINQNNELRQTPTPSSRPDIPLNSDNELNHNAIPIRRPEVPLNSFNESNRIAGSSNRPINQNNEPNRNVNPIRRPDMSSGQNNESNRNVNTVKRPDIALNSNNESNRNINPSRCPDMPSGQNTGSNRDVNSTRRPDIPHNLNNNESNHNISYSNRPVNSNNEPNRNVNLTRRPDMPSNPSNEPNRITNSSNINRSTIQVQDNRHYDHRNNESNMDDNNRSGLPNRNQDNNRNITDNPSNAKSVDRRYESPSNRNEVNNKVPSPNNHNKQQPTNVEQSHRQINIQQRVSIGDQRNSNINDNQMPSKVFSIDPKRQPINEHLRHSNNTSSSQPSRDINQSSRDERINRPIQQQREPINSTNNQDIRRNEINNDQQQQSVRELSRGNIQNVRINQASRQVDNSNEHINMNNNIKSQYQDKVEMNQDNKQMLRKPNSTGSIQQPNNRNTSSSSSHNIKSEIKQVEDRRNVQNIENNRNPNQQEFRSNERNVDNNSRIPSQEFRNNERHNNNPNNNPNNNFRNQDNRNEFQQQQNMRQMNRSNERHANQQSHFNNNRDNYNQENRNNANSPKRNYEDNYNRDNFRNQRPRFNDKEGYIEYNNNARFNNNNFNPPNRKGNQHLRDKNNRFYQGNRR